MRPFLLVVFSLGFTGPVAASNLAQAFSKLEETKTGRRLVAEARAKARSQGKNLMDLIKPGDISLTDTTLIRRFSRTRPSQIFYEGRTVITINKNLRAVEAMQDLAHELVHFARREPFNPYHSDFDLKGLVSSILEGKGGEVEAFLTECKISAEFMGGITHLSSNCQDIINDRGEFDRALGIQKFYRVGRHYKDLVGNLKAHGVNPSHFSALSDKEPLFISSAAGLPYPVAAYNEYTAVKRRSCENDRQRLLLLKEMNRKDYGQAILSFEGRCPELKI